MIQTTPHHRSFKRPANRTAQANTFTVPEGVAENIAPPLRPSAVDPHNPDLVTRKTASTQSKQNDPTSRMMTRRKPFHRFRRNPSYTSITATQFREKFHGSRTQTSTIPASMSRPLIQYLCRTVLEKAPSPN